MIEASVLVVGAGAIGGVTSAKISTLKPAASPFRRVVRKSSRGAATSVEPYRLGRLSRLPNRARPERKKLKARAKPEALPTSEGVSPKRADKRP